MNRVRAAISRNPLLVDSVIAAALTAVTMLALAAGSQDLGPAGQVNLVLLLLQTVPLALRRRHPILVLAIVAGALNLQLVILPLGGTLSAVVGFLIAIYTVGEIVDRRRSMGATLVAGVALATFMFRAGGFPGALQAVIQTMSFVAAAWYLGDTIRIRRLYTRSVESEARLLRMDRESRERQAIREERERIARELHDAVTHHVSVIVIQAGGGLRALQRRPAEARSALEAIDATGRQALADMRRMLGILGDGGNQEPLPGLDRLGDLLELVRAAGMSVELSIQGDRRPLDPGLELSAYRIVQEGLTNSLKHGRGGRARVTVRYGPSSLDIAIDDERGPGVLRSIEPAHEGRGLVGMRERVAMFRGTFAAEPTPNGFRVSAMLPIDDSVPAT